MQESAKPAIRLIKAAARARGGKGAARAVRREGKVPGVVYGGDKAEAEMISIDAHELNNTIMRGRFRGTVFDLDVDGRTSRVIPRDVQRDPIMDFPVHVDFQRIGASNRVRVGVPMRFINEALSPGLKRGGVLNIVRREVEVWSPADNIPDYFEADMTGLEIGRSIHISAIKLPDGVTPTITDRDFTVATIAGAVKSEEEATPGVAAADGAAPAADAAAPAADAKAAPAAAPTKK
jgi:large subunit ribosomal protein L25